MKARIKKTGEIINIASYAKITLESCDSWGSPIEVFPEEIELIDDNQINSEEEQLRHLEIIRQQAAIAAMQGLLAYSGEACASDAVIYADALIGELKRK